MQALRSELANIEATATTTTTTDEPPRRGSVHVQEEPEMATIQGFLSAPNSSDDAALASAPVDNPPDGLTRVMDAAQTLYNIGQRANSNAHLVEAALNQPRPDHPQLPQAASASSPPSAPAQPPPRRNAIPIIDPATGRPIGQGGPSGRGRGQ